MATIRSVLRATTRRLLRERKWDHGERGVDTHVQGPRRSRRVTPWSILRTKSVVRIEIIDYEPKHWTRHS